ncbi:type III-A CRISPR-associated protein Csm2 [Thermococcus sp.]
MGYQREYGGYGRSKYERQGHTRTDVSGLFGEIPDINGIKNALEKGGINRDAVKPYFARVVDDAGEFPRWSPEKRLANAVTVAAYLVVQRLKTNQVRRILEMARTTELKVRRGGTDIKNDIIRMRYLLAYTVGKATGQSKYPIEAFHSVLDPMLKVLMKDPTKENFERFYDFLQAVVAYHRFFGGRE